MAAAGRTIPGPDSRSITARHGPYVSRFRAAALGSRHCRPTAPPAAHAGRPGRHSSGRPREQERGATPEPRCRSHGGSGGPPTHPSGKGGRAVCPQPGETGRAPHPTASRDLGGRKATRPPGCSPRPAAASALRISRSRHPAPRTWAPLAAALLLQPHAPGRTRRGGSGRGSARRLRRFVPQCGRAGRGPGPPGPASPLPWRRERGGRRGALNGPGRPRCSSPAWRSGGAATGPRARNPLSEGRWSPGKALSPSVNGPSLPKPFFL